MPTLRPRKTVDEASLQQEGERGIDCTAPDQAKQPEEANSEPLQPPAACRGSAYIALVACWLVAEPWRVDGAA